MRVRPYTDADLDALRRMHAQQGFDYKFPDLADPIYISKLVLVDDEPPSAADLPLPAQAGAAAGRPLMAILARLTAEAYLLMDPSAGGGPRERWERFLLLHAAAERDVFSRGLDDVHCWLPPRVAKSFGRRLERLGWTRDDAWPPYCRRLAAPPA